MINALSELKAQVINVQQYTHRFLITSVFTTSLVAPGFAHADLSESSELTSGTSNPIAIAIHGGAGTITKANLSEQQAQEYRAKLQEALLAGYAELKAGKDGQYAVISAIQILEQSPLFNAGIGAVYTYAGEHELDASIMHGANRLAGAVSGVKTIASPIAAAQAVMNHSVHVMLSGRGAEEFAQEQGLAQVDNHIFDTERRYKSLQKAKRAIADSQTELLEFQDYKFGTVGAVVLDQQGNVVAGTSTGGMTAKRYGRIGDSPIIGAGTFADNNSCAVSATGHGEYFIRYQVAVDICARMAYQGLSLQAAADKVVNEVLVEADGSGGVIAIDKAGNIAMPFNTEGMYRASIDIHGKMSIAIYR
jgi:beta-aspartyl-peptidase (threonine type)